MSRPIKFRCWNEAVKLMYPLEHFGIAMNGDTLQLMPECEHYDKPFEVNNGGSMVFMQFTGLKDRNGKDIYEGDIVIITGKGFRHTAIIEESENVRGFEILSELLRFKHGKDAEWEVIGNIYENSDLLPTGGEK